MILTVCCFNLWQVLSLIYFYSHYAFASGAAHIGAMYTAFLSVAVALGKIFSVLYAFTHIFSYALLNDEWRALFLPFPKFVLMVQMLLEPLRIFHLCKAIF